MKKPSRETVEKVIKALEARYPGWVSPSDIAGELNLSEKYVADILRILAESGVVETLKARYKPTGRPRILYRVMRRVKKTLSR